jgi:hypothetical protein
MINPALGEKAVCVGFALSMLVGLGSVPDLSVALESPGSETVDESVTWKPGAEDEVIAVGPIETVIVTVLVVGPVPLLVTVNIYPPVEPTTKSPAWLVEMLTSGATVFVREKEAVALTPVTVAVTL